MPSSVSRQWWAAPFVAAGTFAEYIAMSEDAPMVWAPDGQDPAIALAQPVRRLAYHVPVLTGIGAIFSSESIWANPPGALPGEFRR